jgi:hypothetical protein
LLAGTCPAFKFKCQDYHLNYSNPGLVKNCLHSSRRVFTYFELIARLQLAANYFTKNVKGVIHTKKTFDMCYQTLGIAPSPPTKLKSDI